MTVPPPAPRRILVVGKFYAEGFALHIAETLEAMGHAVGRFDYGLRHRHRTGRLSHTVLRAVQTAYELANRLPVVRAARTRALLEAAATHAPDLIVVTYDYLFPAEVAALKARTGARIALWYPDAISNLGRMLFVNAPYDAVFFKDPYVVQAFDGVAAAPLYYLPEAFNPRRHRLPDGPLPDLAPYRCDVTTAGNLHAHRVAAFKHLARFDVKVWGNPPPLWLDPGPVGRMFQGRYVAYEEKALAFTAAKIVVNTLHPAEIWGVNVRTFEAAGVGAFQLVDGRPALADLFEDGRELVTFSGMDDLKAKVAYYLARPDERAAIAEAGRVRAHREHTYRHRLGLLLQTLDGAAEGFPRPDIRYATVVRSV